MSSADTIQMTWLGHSCFKLECGGHTAVIDPYDEIPGLPLLHAEAGEVFKSHDHHDHGWLQAVTLVEEAGASPFEVTTYPTWHDDQQGALRGPNLITVFEAAGLKIAHFGDLGEPLSQELIDALQGLDAALIPVGGFYTIDGAQAYEIMEQLDPKLVVPMHFRRGDIGFDVIAEPEEFTKLVTDRPVIESDSNVICIGKDDEKRVVVMTYRG